MENLWSPYSNVAHYLTLQMIIYHQFDVHLNFQLLREPFRSLWNEGEIISFDDTHYVVNAANNLRSDLS